MEGVVRAGRAVPRWRGVRAEGAIRLGRAFPRGRALHWGPGARADEEVVQVEVAVEDARLVKSPDHQDRGAPDLEGLALHAVTCRALPAGGGGERLREGHGVR